MLILNGKKVALDSPITINEVQYPNLRDPSVREMLGVVEVPDPVMPDLRYNYVSENEDGSLTVTPKPQEQIDQMLQAELNVKSLAYLASTDWYVTRFAETAVPIPDAVLALRIKARADIVHLELPR
jgi:hypothetical protein